VLLRYQSAIALFTCGCLVSVASSPANVGFVVTGGQVMVDGATIRGNATLFQGNVVRAGDASSDVMLAGGSNLLLQPGAQARVFRDYEVLEHGSAVEHGMSPVMAAGLTVTSMSPQGSVLVEIQDSSHIRVQAQDAAAEVHNPGGSLVARLDAGKGLSLALQAAAAPQAGETAPPALAPATGAQVTIHGILRKDHPGRYGHYFVTDLVSKATFELQGPGLDDLVGASVEATGSALDSAPAPGASQVLSVSDVHQMPLSEMQQEVPGVAPANPPSATPAPSTNAPAEAPPAPAEAPATPPAVSPEGPAPEPTPEPAEASVPQPPPLPVHSATPKILLVTALAAGAVVGVALGLGGGKSSTVSPE
jgi:hypothetical protein